MTRSVVILGFPGVQALDLVGPHDVFTGAAALTKGVAAVSDRRVVRDGRIVTSAGVSAGIDLALWLAGQIGGENRAKVI